MTAIQAISKAIIEKISCGMEVKQAIDAVLGSGAFDKLAGEIYDDLKNQ